MAECDHRWVSMDGDEPFCKLCQIKQSDLQKERSFIKCLHVQDGASIEMSIPFGEGRYVQFCSHCWDLVKGKVLSDVMAKGMALWAAEQTRRMEDGA